MAGVPTAVLRQREKLEAELGMRADGTPSTPPPAQPPDLSLVQPSAPETPPATPAAPDAATLQARVDELEHLLKTRDGQTSASMREANEARQREGILTSQVQALEEGLATLQKQLETAEARAASKAADATLPSLDGVEELTPQEIELFGKDSVGFVEKLTKKQLVSYFKPMLAKLEAMEKQLDRVRELDKLPQLEKVVKEAESETQRVREEDFFRNEILKHYPDFEEVRETQAWRDYLAADIPGRGIKNHHLLNQYRLARNAPGIRSIIQAHYDAVKIKPTLASLATPRGTSTEGTPVVKPRVKASEYNAKLRQFTSRQLSKKEWDAFKSEFQAAYDEGRVDMDARL